MNKLSLNNRVEYYKISSFIFLYFLPGQPVLVC